MNNKICRIPLSEALTVEDAEDSRCCLFCSSELDITIHERQEVVHIDQVRGAEWGLKDVRVYVCQNAKCNIVAATIGGR